MSRSVLAGQATIAATLFDPEALRLACEALPDVEHFMRHEHRLIWSAVLEMHIAGAEVDVVTLAEHIEDQPTDAGSAAYCGEVVANVPGTSNIARYVERVRDRRR